MYIDIPIPKPDDELHLGNNMSSVKFYLLAHCQKCQEYFIAIPDHFDGVKCPSCEHEFMVEIDDCQAYDL